MVGQENVNQPNADYFKENGSMNEEIIIEEEYSASESARETKNLFKTGANSRGDSTNKSQLKDAMNWPFDTDFKKKPTTVG